ncbi:MAG: bifunctional (p)ppGpp synthetase/guanosine-3',5'-bis(diphosphate) 3'-pyrophosphohydrolase [Lachnospiraceae bacterium]|nr:bifunctional (p)ppGpp synthetase/guanosine-3',5'-bis(diphosphate) 3'-pyrophosphohydrolase [Lachnospiraceae bacterium]
MKPSPQCPEKIREGQLYDCLILQAKRRGEEEEICSICPAFCEAQRHCPELQKAFEFTARAHQGQVRKGTDIPYLIHLIRTWDYVRQMSSDIKEQMAALLHDVLEDTPVTEAELCRQFGRDITRLVVEETVNKREGLPPGESWRLRKQETITRLREKAGKLEEQAVMHVAFGDKLANLYSMMYEYRRVGDVLWQKFNQKDKAMHAWYYGEMGKIFGSCFTGREAGLVKEYETYYKEVFGENEISVSK